MEWFFLTLTTLMIIIAFTLNVLFLKKIKRDLMEKFNRELKELQKTKKEKKRRK